MVVSSAGDSKVEPAVVRMYSTRFCPYCMRARSLFKRKGIEFQEIPVGGSPALWTEMVSLSGRNTVPQIFIGDQHVGGYDDVAATDRAGKLDQLLGLI